MLPGSKELIDAIKAVKFSYNSYTMNQATIETGVAAIKDDTYFKNTVSKIIETRENAKKELKNLVFHLRIQKLILFLLLMKECLQKKYLKN